MKPRLRLYGPTPKTWVRWRGLAGQCQQRLGEQQIAVGNPGTILKDVDTLLEFVGTGGIATKSRNASLPGELLPELNAKASHPVQLALKRALLRDYPNVAGIFILARVMDLLQMKGNRLAVCSVALNSWRSLNVTEQYFALLEAFLFHAQSSVLGGEKTREDPESVRIITIFLDQLTDRWRNFDRYDCVRYLGPRGEIPPWRLFVLQQLGVVEIREAEFSDRDRSDWGGGKGWLAGGAKLTPWGAAVGWALLAFLKENGEDDEDPERAEPPDLEEEEVEAGPQAEFGMLQPVFRPYFPEWQTVYALPGSEPRHGTHIFKVELAAWYGGWGDGSVWRRLAVRPGISLDDLAVVILHAFQLENDHMYDFRYRDRRGKSRVYNHPFSDEGPYAWEITVGAADLAAKGTMLFTFDYGDNWRFNLRLEKIEDGPCRTKEPKVLESAGTAPAQYPSFQE